MPTENRSSNTEMVSVPREWLNSVALLQMPLDQLQDQAVEFLCEPCDEPAEQHKGEPVAVLYANGTVLTKADCGDVFDICCKVETPLYTRADPGEVERLRGVVNEWETKWQQETAQVGLLHAQLAERDALLGPIAGWTAETRAAVLEAFQDELNESASYPWYDAAIADLMKLIEALSASAESEVKP